MCMQKVVCIILCAKEIRSPCSEVCKNVRFYCTCIQREKNRNKSFRPNKIYIIYIKSERFFYIHALCRIIIIVAHKTEKKYSMNTIAKTKNNNMMSQHIVSHCWEISPVPPLRTSTLNRIFRAVMAIFVEV